MRMTWLERLCLGKAVRGDRKDPRSGFALASLRSWMDIVTGKNTAATVLDEIQASLILPFVAPYLPPKAALTQKVQSPQPDALGIILTRETAAVFGKTSLSPKSWPALHARIAGRRAFYIDVPAGCVPVRSEQDDLRFDIRAIMCGTYLLPEHPDAFLFLARLVHSGSEKDAGAIAAIIHPDGSTSHIGEASKPDPSQDISFSEASLSPTSLDDIVDQIAELIKLSIAFYYHGPKGSQQHLPAAESRAFSGRKTHRRDRLFAVTALHPSRTSNASSSSQFPQRLVLAEHQTVTGHFKLQAFGPGNANRKMIWVDAYERGSDNGVARPRARIL